MNKIEALKKTILIWDYLAEYPWSTKRHAYTVLDLPLDIQDCPLCEACNLYCAECPLIDFWPCGFCTSQASPYVAWAHDQTAEPARLIADGARAELARLTK